MNADKKLPSPIRVHLRRSSLIWILDLCFRAASVKEIRNPQSLLSG